MTATAGPSWYLNQIGRVPLLTAAQEIELGNAVQAWLNHPAGPDSCPLGIRRRGKRAKDQMVRANLRLVVSIVQRRRPSVDEFMDLVQAGNLGLIRAVELFDPTRGYKFSTYSYWWIKQGIARHLETVSKTIRLPTTEYERLNAIWKATRALTQAFGREPSRSEIAAELQMPVERLNDILQRSQPCTSLDQLVVEDGNSLADLMTSDEPADDDNDPRVERLRRSIEQLDEQAAHVLRRLWGLDGPPQRAKGIAEDLGLTITNVQQIRKRAENQLRLLATDAQPLMALAPVAPVVVEQQESLPLELEHEPVAVAKVTPIRKPRRPCGNPDQLALLPC